MTGNKTANNHYTEIKYNYYDHKDMDNDRKEDNIYWNSMGKNKDTDEKDRRDNKVDNKDASNYSKERQ